MAMKWSIFLTVNSEFDIDTEILFQSVDSDKESLLLLCTIKHKIVQYLSETATPPMSSMV